jgi:60S ribosome biogenesis protein Rrp14
MEGGRGSSGEASTSAASLSAHSRFFDRLVELIPPKYYLHTDADRVNTKYMKKADRAQATEVRATLELFVTLGARH